MRVLQEKVSQQSLSQQVSSSQAAYVDPSAGDRRSHPTGAGTSLSSSGPHLGVPVAASSSLPPGTSSSVTAPSSSPPSSDSRGVSGGGASALRETERLKYVQRGSMAARERRGTGEGPAAAAAATGERGSIAERVARGMYGTMGLEGISNLQIKHEGERERPRQQEARPQQQEQRQRPLGVEGSSGTSVQIARDAVGGARSGSVAGAGREGASVPLGVGGALNVSGGEGEVGGRGDKVGELSQMAAPAHGGLKMVSSVDSRVERFRSGRIHGGLSSFLIGDLCRCLLKVKNRLLLSRAPVHGFAL